MTIDEILANPLIEVTDRHDEIGSFGIKIRGLETHVSIELGRYRSEETTKYRLSHAIHTPMQAGPYWTSNPTDANWEWALHRAIDNLLSFYKKAVDEGYTPAEKWLVEG